MAEFTPQTEGAHRIDIQWSEQPLRQRYVRPLTREVYSIFFSSPFQVQVQPNFEPQKVVVDGPGVRNGIPASLETSFRIDTREAGVEHPEVLIKVNETDRSERLLTDDVALCRIPRVFWCLRKLSIIKMAPTR